MKYAFDVVENFLIKQGLLRFANPAPELQGATVKEKLRHFFDLNNKYNTVSEDERVQCTSLKRRSIGDIYRIVKSYFPETTLEEIKEGLTELAKESIIKSIICSTIRKRVWWKMPFGAVTSFNNQPVDELGFDYPGMDDYAAPLTRFNFNNLEPITIIDYGDSGRDNTSDK